MKNFWLRIKIFMPFVLIVILAAGLLFYYSPMEESPAVVVELIEEEEPLSLDDFGLPLDSFDVESGVVGRGHTLSHMMAGFGLSPGEIDQLARKMLDVFNPRRIRSGQAFYGYFDPGADRSLRHFVYEISAQEYLWIGFDDDVQMERRHKEVVTVPGRASGVIHSSLWNALVDNDIHPSLAIRLSTILAWTVDFYRIQAGDRFKVLYEEEFVGDYSLGVSRVQAVIFEHRGRTIEGFHFKSDTISGYYDQDGQNLRKVFLRAPLEYVRISSRYSQSRLHPIHGDRRPHYGTDYAAPHGTPILAVGDGVVTEARYTSGNGNYVKIRHNSVYETQYLHMSRFADGLRPGTHVFQGEVIGYVGSTGLATGPHVCFRFWMNGRQVDHLQLEFPSGDPLPEEYFRQFSVKVEEYRRRLAQLNYSPLV